MPEPTTAGIDIDGLWQAAQAVSGVTLPGRHDDVHLRGLARFAEAMARGARGSAPALRLARREIDVWVQSYLGFEGDRARYPAIAEVPVEKPLFLAGFGRTGSTLLHHLLALDPASRAPRLWEIWSPSPPPRPEFYCTDPRIGRARRRVEFLAKAAPLVAEVHPMDAQAPDECQWMMRHSPLMVMLYGVPDYWRWLRALTAAELRELYAHYRLQTQHLQLFHRGGHWLSKSFSHLHYLPVLFDVFPDARLVRLHRDPCAAVPSLCSVAASYRSIFWDRVDPGEVGSEILELFTDGMERAMAVDRIAAPQQIVDVLYSDLVADPAGVACGILDRLGYARTPAYERNIRAYLEQAARVPRPTHAYSLEQFGLSRAQVLDRSAAYLAWAADRCGGRLIP
jgi:hypothetical protein